MSESQSPARLNPLERWFLNLPNWNTKRQYVYWFKRFREFARQTPEQMLAMTRNPEELYDVVDLTKQFYNDLVKEGYSKGTASTAMNIVRSFFSYNGAPLPKPPRGFVPREAAFEQRRSLSLEEFRMMIAEADPYERLVLSFLGETGQRRGVLTALKLRHVKDELTGTQSIVLQVPSEIRDKDGRNVNKAGIGYRFGLTSKTTRLLVEHLAQRRANGETIAPESWLLADSSGAPLYGERIRRIVMRAASRARIQSLVLSKKLGKVAAVHPHVFRAFFRDRMLELGVREMLVEEMLGHLVKYRGAYDRHTDAQIREIYSRAEPLLT